MSELFQVQPEHPRISPELQALLGRQAIEQIEAGVYTAYESNRKRRAAQQLARGGMAAQLAFAFQAAATCESPLIVTSVHYPLSIHNHIVLNRVDPDTLELKRFATPKYSVGDEDYDFTSSYNPVSAALVDETDTIVRTMNGFSENQVQLLITHVHELSAFEGEIPAETVCGGCRPGPLST